MTAVLDDWGLPWNWSEEGYLLIGTNTSDRIAVLASQIGISFGDLREYSLDFAEEELPTLLRLIREADDPLRVWLMDAASDAPVAAVDFQTAELDVCRLAYACGDQAVIDGACGPAVQPPAPNLKILKQDIQTLLDRYPDP